MSKLYIGIDNGVTGTIGVIHENYRKMYKIPVKHEQSYTKVTQQITRLRVDEFEEILRDEIKLTVNTLSNVLVLMERPMVNPMRFKASVSAIRCLEASLGVIERIGLSYIYVDSKEWQKVMLPKGLKKEQLKEASLDISRRLFPNIDYKGLKDGDSLLMAEWARRSNL
jgi:hypothetical protein